MKLLKELLQKNIAFFFTAGLLLLLVVAAGIIFASGVARKLALEEQIQKQMQLLDGAHGARGAAPTLEWIEYLRRKENALVQICSEAESLYKKPAALMPKGLLEPLKLKEKILEKQKDMRRKAHLDQLELKEKAVSLGFREYETKIPTTDEVPNITKELEIVQEIINLMCLSRIETLSAAEFLGFKDMEIRNGGDVVAYKVFPLRVRVISPLKNLAELLFRISASEHVFITEGLNIAQSADFKEKVEAEFIVSCVVFRESDEK